MTQVEELNEVRHKYPKAWAYICEMLEQKKTEGFIDALNPSLPKYDDNDELVSAN
jgi:hypothetical protein